MKSLTEYILEAKENPNFMPVFEIFKKWYNNTSKDISANEYADSYKIIKDYCDKLGNPARWTGQKASRNAWICINDEKISFGYHPSQEVSGRYYEIVVSELANTFYIRFDNFSGKSRQEEDKMYNNHEKCTWFLPKEATELVLSLEK